MKKTIIASVLGIVGSVAASSYGQGIVLFNNYAAVTYGFVTYAGGQNVSTANVQLNLLYALGTYADVNSFLASATVVGSATVDPALNTDGAYGNGPGGFYDSGNTVNLAGWTVGATATFMIQAWDTTTGASYATAALSGQSALWTEVVDPGYGSTLTGYGIVPTSAGVPEPMQFGSGVTLVAVPEPSTLALAGLGGFGMLMALRRKKA